MEMTKSRSGMKYSEASTPKKSYLSTKFSSSKLVKENEFQSIKDLGKFEKIDELPESSFNSSMGSNFKWRSKKRLDSKLSKNKGKFHISLSYIYFSPNIDFYRRIRESRSWVNRWRKNISSLQNNDRLW